MMLSSPFSVAAPPGEFFPRIRFNATTQVAIKCCPSLLATRRCIHQQEPGSADRVVFYLESLQNAGYSNAKGRIRVCT